MSSKWTPEALGRVLADMGQRDYFQCEVCPVDGVCDRDVVCVDVAVMLEELNKRGIPVPEHICRCSKEDQCSHS